MHARNRRTGAAITGTLQSIHGRCRLIQDGFERSGDGRITHEHEGGTEMFWDSSEQVLSDGEAIYLDENGEHVPECEIELLDADGTPEGPGARRPRPATKAPHDPEAAARGIAERLIKSMVREVDDYHEALAAACKTSRADGKEEARKAVSETHEAFVRSASSGIEGIDVASELVDLATARDALAPIIHHVDAAVIRLEGPNALQIRCLRNGEDFSVNEVSAQEYGRVCRLKPDKASATQADVYASAILDAWGVTRD